jgi:acetyltransferase-like isoleucine patch superfamily enzyme
MITSNINLGKNISIEKDASVNNIKIGDNTKIANGVKLFGAPDNILEVGKGCIFAANSIVEGYNAQVIIGDYVSFGSRSHILSGSGPSASEKMMQIFPIVRGKIHLGDHSWVGNNVTIMPNVSIGKYCIVAANSFVNKSFTDYSIIGGTPAKLIRKLSKEEIEKLHE